MQQAAISHNVDQCLALSLQGKETTHMHTHAHRGASVEGREMEFDNKLKKQLLPTNTYKRNTSGALQHFSGKEESLRLGGPSEHDTLAEDLGGSDSMQLCTICNHELHGIT